VGWGAGNTTNETGEVGTGRSEKESIHLIQEHRFLGAQRSLPVRLVLQIQSQRLAVSSGQKWREEEERRHRMGREKNEGENHVRELKRREEREERDKLTFLQTAQHSHDQVHSSPPLMLPGLTPGQIYKQTKTSQSGNSQACSSRQAGRQEVNRTFARRAQ
jgi:hypothetical protein